MREPVVWTLLLLLAPSALAQTLPPGWKIVKDAKSVCQIGIPPEWDAWKDSSGAAVFNPSFPPFRSFPGSGADIRPWPDA